MWSKAGSVVVGGDSAATDAVSHIMQKRSRSKEIAGNVPSRYVRTAVLNFSLIGVKRHGGFAVIHAGSNGGKNIIKPIE
ncbi:MAG TPA: hypothetical protein DER23_01285 [Clostridiales bacterium]|nr:hypothetical protein [Clostridiales bacterium]